MKMKTQDKIKRLIEKYKDLCFASDCLNDSNIYIDALDDLKSLIEPECKHENQHPIYYNQMSQQGKQHMIIYDSICSDCGQKQATVCG